MSFFFLLNPKNSGSGSSALTIKIGADSLAPSSSTSTLSFRDEPHMLPVNETINLVINVGTGGYANSDFTTTLFKDGVTTPETVSVNETPTTGFYNVSFTPSSTGLYTLETYYTAAPTTKWVGTFNITSQDITQQTLNHIRSILTRLESMITRSK